LRLEFQAVLELYILRSVVFLIQPSGKGHCFEAKRRFGFGDFSRVCGFRLGVLSEDSSASLGVIAHG
jgi:hypothetical protein